MIALALHSPNVWLLVLMVVLGVGVAVAIWRNNR